MLVFLGVMDEINTAGKYHFSELFDNDARFDTIGDVMLGYRQQSGAGTSF